METSKINPKCLSLCFAKLVGLMQDQSSISSAKTCRFTDSFVILLWRESCSARFYSSILSRRKSDATCTCNLLLSGHHHHYVSHTSRCMHNAVWPTPSVSCKCFGHLPSLQPCCVLLFLLSPSPSSCGLPLAVRLTPSLLSIMHVS